MQNNTYTNDYLTSMLFCTNSFRLVPGYAGPKSILWELLEREILQASCPSCG